ncbi:MAG: hypothetical protein NVS3B6_21400 [Pseudarthrobacter sp.]
MSDESLQKKVDETVEAMEDEQPAVDFEHQVSGEDWHGDAADQANDLRAYEEEAENLAQSRRRGDKDK